MEWPEAVQRIGDAVLTPQPPPPASLLLGAVAVAVLAVVLPGVWRVSRTVLTIAHEGGHAVVALLAGRRLRGIRLHSDTSGLTVSQGRATGPGMVLTLAAGYPAPAVLGLASALAAARGYTAALLWGLLVVLALLLLQIRNLYGLWVVLVAAGVVLAVTWWADPDWQGAFAAAVTAFLLLGAPRPVIEMAVQRRRPGPRTSDADQLARLTRVPGGVWVVLLLLVTTGTAAVGALALVRAWTG